MASATWLQASSLSHALVPILRRRMNLSITRRSFHRISSTEHFLSLSNRLGPPLRPVIAQARRASSFKEDEVATPADLYFEAPLKIVEYPDPILRAKNKRIDTFDDVLKKLVDEMFDIMYKTDGIGLSAPQVGVNVKLMVFNPVGERGEGEEIVLINPRVINYSKKLVLFNEGCLSFPGIYADVKRPESVRIDARDITGARFSVDLTDLPARVFQHEYDHLQGTLFFDRMTGEVLDSIRAELQVLQESSLDTGLFGGWSVCKQSMEGMVVVFSSPYAFQQKGPYKDCFSCIGFSSMVARDTPLHGKLSLHAKCTGLLV